MTDKKKSFLKTNMKLSDEVITNIELICDMLGTDKYAVWIAKEYKEAPEILDYQKLLDVMDWAQSVSPNIMSLDYEEAVILSKEWHSDIAKNSVGKINKKKVDEKRIVYMCKNKKYYFYKLLSGELKQEGAIMGNCVGSNPSYALRLRKGHIIILSFRDINNQPHVTIEIEWDKKHETATTKQIQGKANNLPEPKYFKLISELAKAVADGSFDMEERKEIAQLNKLPK